MQTGVQWRELPGTVSGRWKALLGTFQQWSAGGTGACCWSQNHQPSNRRMLLEHAVSSSITLRLLLYRTLPLPDSPTTLLAQGLRPTEPPDEPPAGETCSPHRSGCGEDWSARATGCRQSSTSSAAAAPAVPEAVQVDSGPTTSSASYWKIPRSQPGPNQTTHQARQLAADRQRSGFTTRDCDDRASAHRRTRRPGRAACAKSSTRWTAAGSSGVQNAQHGRAGRQQG